MARSTAEINNELVSNLVSFAAAIGLTIDPLQWSKRNIFRLICWTVASAIATFEQLQDSYKLELENIASSAPAGSALWVQRKMFEFQYSATTPQVVEIQGGNLSPAYPLVDESLRIITACSVKPDLSNNVIIKVAKSNPFVKLDSTEKSAAQSYINIIGTAGIVYKVQSDDADELYIQADVIYKGEFAPVIAASVIDNINAFLQTLSVNQFGGQIQMSDLEGVIRNTTGVTDLLLKNVQIRSAAQSFGSGTDLILNQEVVVRRFEMSAGYAIQETTSGQTFLDSLNFIAE